MGPPQSADCKSAIQQINNLRYESGVPASRTLGTSTRWSFRGAATVLVLGGLLAFAGLAPAAPKPVEIRVVTLAPRGSSPHLSLLKLGELWQKKSGGQVKLTVIPDYRAGGEAAMVDKMSVGGVDGAVMTVVGLSKINPDVTALACLPMMFRSLEEVDYVGEQLQPDLAGRLEQKGYVPLFWTDIGWVQYFSVEPMIRPADLKRMKVFVWAGETAHVDLMKDWGTHPVALEPADILTSLQTGMINAVPAPPFTANAGQYALKAKYMLELNWAPMVGGAVVRKKAWEKVPAELRADLLQSAADIGREIKVAGRKESEEAVGSMRNQKGLAVHKPTPGVLEEWRQATASVYPRIRGAIVPADMFDKVVALLQNYRAGKGEKK